MKKYLLLIFCVCLGTSIYSQRLTKELINVKSYTEANQTPEYTDVIRYYNEIATADNRVRINDGGQTDCYYRLSEVIIDGSSKFTPESARSEGKVVIFINNGIHPGEPDGIDATLWWLQDILRDKDSKLLDNVVFVIIPVYNIDGALVRNSTLRFTQNGPEEYGYRGNGQNLDLNRDFIKCDSRNAQSFVRLFTKWNPDILIDNHVSDGADYQHIMTLLPTQIDKLGYQQADFMRRSFMPSLFHKMEVKGYPMAPYINVWGTTPDKGLPGFMDTPRYSSGYAALFQTYSFVPECHMLKTYGQRVKANRALLESFSEFAVEKKSDLLHSRKLAVAAMMRDKVMPVRWELDTIRADSFYFRGYGYDFVPSAITGLPRLRYRRDRPFQKNVPYYSYANVTDSVSVPEYYIIPQGWYRVIERLNANGVDITTITKDSMISASAYYIDEVKAIPKPYEGHFIHFGTMTHTENGSYQVRKGDFIVSTHQKARRFIVETLEPRAMDSYFSWNFFDAILNRKEGFSDYVFEDMLPEIIQKQSELKNELKQWIVEHPEYKSNGFAQLNFLYEHSKFDEPWANRYPVLKVYH